MVISAPCTLGSDRAGPGDVIVATVTPIDSLGMSGTPVSSQPLTDLADIRPSTGQPGRTVCGLRGGGWGPVERVDLHVDAESGTKVGSVTTDDTGQFSQGRMTLPSPLPGGIHDLVGVGLTRGLVYHSSVTVTSIGALVPNRVAAGDAAVFAGDGFVPGETVTAAFPNGGQSVSGVAAADGSVSLSLTSPPEPAPGGNVTVVAPSGTFTEPYFTKSAMTLPDSAEPGDQVPVLATGFGPNESVKVRFERGSVTQTFTSDSVGTVSGSLLIATTYGKPQVTLTGLSSRVRASAFISLPAQMTLSPTAGKVGTVVTVTSGPGWVAGETLRLYWAGTLLKKLTASQKGTISKTFTVPKHSPGDANVKLQDDLLNQLASATFTVKP